MTTLLDVAPSIDWAKSDLYKDSPILLPLSITVNGAKLIFLAICITITSLAFAVCIRSPQFHRNLIVLIYNTTLLFYIGCLCTLVDACVGLLYPLEALNFEVQFSPILVVINYVRMGAIIGITVTFPLLAFERVLATVYIAWYEHYRGNLFIMPALVVIWLLPGAIIALIRLRITSFIFWLVVGLASDTISIGVFLMTTRTNRANYAASCRIGTSVSLTHRYQLSENIRSAALMHGSLLAGTICSFAGTTILAVGEQCSNNLARYLANIAFNLNLLVLTLSFPLVAIHAHAAWRRQFYALVSRALSSCACCHRLADSLDRWQVRMDSRPPRLNFCCCHRRRRRRRQQQQKQQRQQTQVELSVLPPSLRPSASKANPSTSGMIPLGGWRIRRYAARQKSLAGGGTDNRGKHVDGVVEVVSPPESRTPQPIILNLRRLDGRPMVMSVEEQGQYYFNSLQDIWWRPPNRQ